MLFDLASLSGHDTYKLLVSTIVPRPIAWVTTMDAAGALNAAPYSFFNAMSGSPPVVCIGIGPRGPGEAKDTGANISATGEFVVNLVGYANREPMNVTATEFPPDIDELRQAGLETAPSTKVRPPRIADSPVSMECERIVCVEVGPGRTVVLGRVLAIHVRDDCVLDAARCYIDTPKLDLIGRLHGGGWYARMSELFEMPRLNAQDWTLR